mgnify:CR=1 FL=1
MPRTRVSGVREYGHAWTSTNLSTDVVIAIKLVAAKLDMSQRVLTDWLLIRGLVPFLRDLSKIEENQIYADGAADLTERRAEIERMVQRAQRRTPRVGQEQDLSAGSQ